jgi:hypothetical protein
MFEVGGPDVRVRPVASDSGNLGPTTGDDMLSVHSLDPSLIMLVGRLATRRNWSGPMATRGKPGLVISVWNPWGRSTVEVEVPDSFGLEAVVEAEMGDRKVHVGLHPSNRVADRATIAAQKASLRRWLVERRLQEGKPIDRIAIERELTGLAYPLLNRQAIA